MGAQVLNAGDYETRRMSKIIICARTMRNTVSCSNRACWW
jgi:phosphate acetyltransferase